ncbi:MAG: acyl-CoA dehydrogenase family protein, partial [Myxococcota bacterium]
WSVAKALLMHERQSIASSELVVANDDRRVFEHALDQLGVHDGILADPILRGSIAQWEVDKAAFDATVEQAQADYRAGAGNPATASLLKYYGAELNKRKFELLMEIAGNDALVWQKSDGETVKLPRSWLRSKGNSIEGGTSEVQLNILAKHVLRLPGA